MLFSSSPIIDAGPIFDKFSRELAREHILHVKKTLENQVSSPIIGHSFQFSSLTLTQYSWILLGLNLNEPGPAAYISRKPFYRRFS